MSKVASGLFDGTSGFDPHIHRTDIQAFMYISVREWAIQQFNELTGKARKNFNTACVAFDQATHKFYYGRNAGYREDGYVRNPVLFGDSTHTGILPKHSLNKYPVGNCAEVDAINRALNDGAKLEDLHITTIHTTKKQFGKYKAACENCTYAFRGKISENYSGWGNGGKQ